MSQAPSASVESVSGELMLRLEAAGKIALFNLSRLARGTEGQEVTETIRGLVEDHLQKIPGWKEGKPSRVELELGTEQDPPGFGKFWEYLASGNFYRDPRRFSIAVWHGALEWWRSQPPGIREPAMGWLFGHCRAIGMVKKSESGSMRDDIAAFTIDQQAEIEKMKREREDWPGERLRRVFRDRLHAYLNDLVSNLRLQEAGQIIRDTFAGYEKEVEEALRVRTEAEQHQAERPMPVDIEPIVVAALFDFLAFLSTSRTPVLLGYDQPTTTAIQLLLEWAKGKVKITHPAANVHTWVAKMREASGHEIALELTAGDPVEALAGLLMRQKYMDQMNPRTWGEARDVARRFLNQQSLVRLEMPAAFPPAPSVPGRHHVLWPDQSRPDPAAT